MTVIIERYRAIKWIKNLRRRDGDHTLSSSASNCVSSKSSQYIKIHVPMQEWLTARFDQYLVRLLDTKCLTHCPHLILTTHSWLGNPSKADIVRLSIPVLRSLSQVVIICLGCHYYSTSTSPPLVWLGGFSVHHRALIVERRDSTRRRRSIYLWLRWREKQNLKSIGLKTKVLH